MIMALQRGELCVRQITELTGLAISAVSRHLPVLYQAGLAAPREEKLAVYRRVRDEIRGFVKSLPESLQISKKS